MAGLVPGSSTIYLESYIESTGSLPPELQRILTTISALDDRCLQLSESIHNSLAILLKPDSHGTLHEQAEYQEASNSIGVEQQLLLQFAEEKVQLAHRAHGLLEMHALELEQSIDDFEGELRLTGALEPAPSSEYFPPLLPEAPVLPPERDPPAREREREREREKERARSSSARPQARAESDYGLVPLQETPAPPLAQPLVSLPPVVLPKTASYPPLHRTTSHLGFSIAPVLPNTLAPPSLVPSVIPTPSASTAFLGSAAPLLPGAAAAVITDGSVLGGAVPAHWAGEGSALGELGLLQGRDSMGHLMGVASKGKRPREEEAAAILLQQQHHHLQQPQHLAQLLGGQNVQPLLKKKTPTSSQVNQPQGTSMAEVSTMNIDPAVTLTIEDPPPPDTVRFRRPPPRSFKESAPTPQAPGQYLGDLDIGPGLIGRHAELWWPDDSLWYLIEIQEVDMASKRAKVLYSTGDIEELELEQTAKDKHMVLIGQQYYT